jgi:hypothetical protein
MPPKKKTVAPPKKRAAPVSRAPPAEAAAADAEDDDTDFAALMEEFIKNPDAINEMTEAQVLELQRRFNPYGRIAGPAPDEERQRAVAVSYTNLREDYLRRLTMTSLVGFVFQMLHEWEVPADQRRWAPADQRRWAPADAPAAPAPYTPAQLVERLRATLAVAEEAAAAAAEADAAKVALSTAVTAPGAVDADAAAKAESAAARAAGLLYAATHAGHVLGREATARLRPTADAGMVFPEVAAVLAKYPMPARAESVEMPADRAKGIVEGFLRHYFEFDPATHVRSAGSADAIRAAVERVAIGAPGQEPVEIDAADPRHLTIEAIRAAAPRPAPEHAAAVERILESARDRAAVMALLADEALGEAAVAAVADPVAFRHYLAPVAAGSPARPAADTVPPQDTFHRWNYYTEVNYEELRAVAEALYPERADLDWALAVWEYFEGTPKEVKDAFDKHCQKYQDDVPSSIKLLTMHQWSLLANFKENRKNIEFYNRHTEVLKRILDRHAEDQRAGAKLMRNRVRTAKAKNIAEDGPDAPGLSKYRAAVAKQGNSVAAAGAERVISPEEMLRLEKARGNRKAAQELELLEQTEKTIADLEATQKLRALDPNEADDLRRARESIGAIREMANVPENAIQVDVFVNDGGTMKKDKMYTLAEAPEHLRREEAGGASSSSSHPAAGLAPYAAAHHAESARPRTDAQLHAEALAAAPK